MLVMIQLMNQFLFWFCYYFQFTDDESRTKIGPLLLSDQIINFRFRMCSYKWTDRELYSIWALSFSFLSKIAICEGFINSNHFFSPILSLFTGLWLLRWVKFFQSLKFAGMSGDRLRWNGSGRGLINSDWYLNFLSFNELNHQTVLVPPFQIVIVMIGLIGIRLILNPPSPDIRSIAFSIINNIIGLPSLFSWFDFAHSWKDCQPSRRWRFSYFRSSELCFHFLRHMNFFSQGPRNEHSNNYMRKCKSIVHLPPFDEGILR
jgi:hypothetical protein